MDNIPYIWIGDNGDVRVETFDDKEEDVPVSNEYIKVDHIYHPAFDTKIVKKLPPGFYGIYGSQGKYQAEKQFVNTDELIQLPNSKIEEIAKDIQRFWTTADKFKAAGVLHKRGIMFHGKPGCGKTSTVHMLSVSIIKKGGIVFHVRSANDLRILITFVLSYFRDIEPETPIVVVVEDIDQIVHQDESLVLNWLSGENEFNHCVVVATTNRIRECNDLLLRPTRFDYVVELQPPAEDARQRYLVSKKLEQEEASEWAKKTEGFSMAQLKELFISVKLLENNFEAVVDKITNQEKNITLSTYEPKKTSVGFNIKK